DPYVGADPFTVRVTDAEGASTLAFVLTEHMRGVGPKSRNCDATAWAMSDDDTAANSRLALDAFTSAALLDGGGAPAIQMHSNSQLMEPPMPMPTIEQLILLH